MPTKKRTAKPSRVDIASYWAKRGLFDLDQETPLCFACRLPPILEDSASWNHSYLQRCHIVAEAEGGTNDLSNLVLLCDRCHAEAPMVSAVPEAMAEWISRRENWLSWRMRRVIEEMNAISPDLLQRAAVALNLDGFEASFSEAYRFLKVGYHPGGDIAATIAAVIDAMVKLGPKSRTAAGSQE